MAKKKVTKKKHGGISGKPLIIGRREEKMEIDFGKLKELPERGTHIIILPERVTLCGLPLDGCTIEGAPESFGDYQKIPSPALITCDACAITYDRLT